MARFEPAQPMLPSHLDASLDDLRSDPMWITATESAGLDMDRCELVIRVDSATVWTGDEPGSPYRATPALLLGRGGTLAIAFPDGRAVRVVTRPNFKAQLQTQRSGDFQILFAPPSQMPDAWMFDGITAGTPSGAWFGQTILRFLRGQHAQPARAPSAGTSGPPTPSGSPWAASAEPTPSPPTVTLSRSVPRPANQDRETVRQLVQRLAAVCGEVMQLQSSCEKKGEEVQKVRHVAAQPQHPMSRTSFLGVAERKEKEFLALLSQLREAIAKGRRLEEELAFLAGVLGRNTVHLVQALPADVFIGEELATIAVGGLYLHLDFGSSMDTFYATTDRLAQAMSSIGPQ